MTEELRDVAPSSQSEDAQIRPALLSSVFATASLVLGITSLAFLILILMCFICGSIIGAY
jgi:hypothetical protein